MSTSTVDESFISGSHSLVRWTETKKIVTITIHIFSNLLNLFALLDFIIQHITALMCITSV